MNCPLCNKPSGPNTEWHVDCWLDWQEWCEDFKKMLNKLKDERPLELLFALDKDFRKSVMADFNRTMQHEMLSL